MSQFCKILTIISLLWPYTVYSSGFGWYVNTIRWGDFKKDIDPLIAEAKEIISASPENGIIKQYFQDRIEGEIYSRYCNAQGLHGQDLSPFFEEFYSVRFVEYASSLQKKNGIQNSLFYRFANHIPYISLSKKSVMAELNPYFLLSPQETEQASVELRNFNIKNKHPAEFQHVARHLEGVLLASANDKTPDNISSLSAGLKTGVMFCGHD